MRHLRTYMCAYVNESECMKKTRDLCESHHKLIERLGNYNPKNPARLDGFENDEEKLLARIYAHILHWGIAEPGFSIWKEEKKINGDETQLLRTYMNEVHTHCSFFLKNYMRAHMYASCTVNGRTFFYLDYKDITYQSNNIKLVFTYYTARNTVTSTPLRYRTRHGPVVYNGREMTLGVYTLSVHAPGDEPCIYSCHMNWRIDKYYFQYHLCTNTLRYCKNKQMPTDYACARGHIVELWCRKREIVQKFMARIRSAHTSDEVQTVRNFL